MSYIFENTSEHKLIKEHDSCSHWPEKHSRTPAFIDKTTWSYLYDYVGVKDKHLLGKKNQLGDCLNNLHILNKTDHIMSCQNPYNNESFNVTAYMCDITYNITIKEYKHYMGFSSSVNTIAYYNHTDNVPKQLGFTVADILKYYYYTHKEVDNYGFDPSESSSVIKSMWSIVKKSLSHGSKIHNIPLGTCKLFPKNRWSSYSQLETDIIIWNINNHNFKWDFETFCNSIILMDYTHFIHPTCAINLIYMYLIGTNTNLNRNPTKIIFDEPKSLVEVINEYENKKDNNVVYVINRINSKLNKTQKEELESYPEYVLDKGFCIDRESEKMFTYPIFAFRNMYVQEWVPIESIKQLYDIISQKVHLQRSQKLKRDAKRKGKYIYLASDSKIADKYTSEIYNTRYCDNKYGRHYMSMMKKANQCQLSSDTKDAINDLHS